MRYNKSLLCVVGCLGMQALLVRTIAGLRRNTAARTDERVRLTGEVIQVRQYLATAGISTMSLNNWQGAQLALHLGVA